MVELSGGHFNPVEKLTMGYISGDVWEPTSSGGGIFNLSIKQVCCGRRNIHPHTKIHANIGYLKALFPYQINYWYISPSGYMFRQWHTQAGEVVNLKGMANL